MVNNRIIYPNAELSQIVEYYWYCRIDSTDTLIQHYATPLFEGVAFNLSCLEAFHTYEGKTTRLYKKAYLFGQSIGPQVITTSNSGVDIIGVKFKPLGIAHITGINMEQLIDRIVPAEDIWGNELEWLCEAMKESNTIEAALLILDRFLMLKYRATQKHPRMENVAHAVSLIDIKKGNINVQDIQCHTNTSKKTLQRAFVKYLGLRPKVYSQIVRFNHAKHLIDNCPTLDTMNLVYQLGYFDQSHFAAEFKRFSGQTPTGYFRATGTMEKGHPLPEFQVLARSRAYA